MKSLSVKVKGAEHPSIMEDRRMQSSCTRCAYNDFEKRGLSLGESYTRCSGMFNKLGSHLVNEGVRRGQWIFKGVKEARKSVETTKTEKRRKEEKKVKRIENAAKKEGKRVNGRAILWKRRKKNIKNYNKRLKEGQKPKPVKQKRLKRKDWQPYFGEFTKRKNGLISREEYKESRLMPLLSEGEKMKRGNRLLEFDVENGRYIYKRNRDEHIELKIDEKLSKSKLYELKKLERMIENNETPVTFSLEKNKITFVFDDAYVHKDIKTEEKKELKPDRVMALDLNPNYIGVAILEKRGFDSFKMLDKFVFDLTELNSIHNKNKRKHELIQVNYKLMTLCRHYRVEKIAVEELKMRSKDKGFGRKNNRLLNNDWVRRQIVENLKVLCNRHGQDLVEVKACYSSMIGNILYGNETTPDMVAAAMELALRAPTINFTGRVLPDFDKLKVKSESTMKYGNLWKELPWSDVSGWKDLFKQTKNLELRYRVSLENTVPRGQRFYRKMLVSKHSYI